MAHLLAPFDGSQLCADVDKDWFFPDDLEDEPEVFSLKVLNAKAVCLECPLSISCLEYAVKTPYLEGIWGGTTQHERKLMRRRIKAREKR